jgi:hypothetical protein
VQSPFPEDPLAGATVELFGPGDSTEQHATHTDERGRFKIEGLAPGEYSLHVRASGFNSVIGKVVISKKAPRKKIRIELASGV